MTEKIYINAVYLDGETHTVAVIPNGDKAAANRYANTQRRRRGAGWTVWASWIPYPILRVVDRNTEEEIKEHASFGRTHLIRSRPTLYLVGCSDTLGAR